MVKTGLDRVKRAWPRELRGLKIGLVVHPASVDRRLVHAIDRVLQSELFVLNALFGPQHGIRGETQDNMVEWGGFHDRKTGLPVHSLYSDTRKPLPDMLEDIDALVVDIQDVGARYYTFIWTLELCMQACNEMSKFVVVLDRPNPLNGKSCEGPVLHPAFASFVGNRPLPVRHGMTIGEIGKYLWKEFYPTLEYRVVPLERWNREDWFDQTGLPWVLPSPNMPTLDTAIVYPGMCLLEGTNLSEGRGTTRPFELFGAPFIEPEVLVRHLKGYKLPGVFFRPLFFQPTFQKHTGVLCGGAQIHVVNRDTFRPFKTGVAILKAVHDLYPEEFTWKEPPYEYETEKMPIDVLAGTDQLRKDIEKGKGLTDMETWWNHQLRTFRNVRKRFLLYE